MVMQRAATGLRLWTAWTTTVTTWLMLSRSKGLLLAPAQKRGTRVPPVQLMSGVAVARGPLHPSLMLLVAPMVGRRWCKRQPHLLQQQPH
jgi:hypothetical protein